MGDSVKDPGVVCARRRRPVDHVGAEAWIEVALPPAYKILVSAQKLLLHPRRHPAGTPRRRSQQKAAQVKGGMPRVLEPLQVRPQGLVPRAEFPNLRRKLLVLFSHRKPDATQGPCREGAGEARGLDPSWRG